MATKYISGTISGYYSLSEAYTSLTLGPNALIDGLLEGNSQTDTITNLGRVTGGILLFAAGTIINGSISDTTAAVTGAVLGGWYPGGVGRSGLAGINLPGGSVGNDGTIAGGAGGYGIPNGADGAGLAPGGKALQQRARWRTLSACA